METGSTAGKSTLAGTMASARHATMMAFATPMAASGMETGNRLRHQCRARHPRSCQGTVGCAGRQGCRAVRRRITPWIRPAVDMPQGSKA